MKTLIYAGLFLAGTLVAQDADHLLFFSQAVPPPPPPAPQAGANTAFISGQMVSSGVKGSPYSADSVIETSQVLADGNKITNRNTTRQYRDSEGRERREMTLGLDGSTQLIMISDPIAGISYTLNPAQKTAQKMVTGSSDRLREAAGQSQDFNVRVREGIAGTARAGVVMQGAPGAMIMNRTEIRIASTESSTETSAAEDLGTRVIEGVMATGNRRKSTIPAGQIGNDRPIETSVETWFSPELKMTVLSETTDPRMGTTVMKLTNVSRTEPLRALFEVPAGYAVTEGPSFTFAGPAIPAQRVEFIPRRAEKQ